MRRRTVILEVRTLSVSRAVDEDKNRNPGSATH